MNAPKAGKIVQLLAEEDATVIVGQDLFLIEFGDPEEAPATSKPTQPIAQPRSPPSDKIAKDEPKKPIQENVNKKEKKIEEDPKVVPSPGNRGETRVGIPLCNQPGGLTL